MVATGAGDYGHQFGSGCKEIGQLPGRLLDQEPGAQAFFLRGNADRTVIGFAGSHTQTTDGLKGRIRYGNRIGTQRQRFHKIRRHTQPARNNQRYVTNA